MTEIKQRNMQVFIITKDIAMDEVRQFVAKNHNVLKLHLLLVEELSGELKALLDEYGLDYLQPKNFNFNRGVKIIRKEHLIYEKSAESKSIISQNLAKNAEFTNAESPNLAKNADSNSAESTIKYFKGLIRSGVEIDTNSNIVIFHRVNSGAKIRTNKSVFIFGKCDGDVRCDGEYMILSQISNGKILFNGMAINQSMLKYKLNLIAKDGDIGLKISDIFNIK